MLKPSVQQLLNFCLWDVTFVDNQKQRRRIQLVVERSTHPRDEANNWLKERQQLDPDWQGWRFGDCTQITGTAIDFEPTSF